MSDERSSERSFERTARLWLEQGANQAPERAVQAVLLAIETTPQERDLRIPWRFPTMTTPVRVGMAAVIGVLLLGAGFYLLGGGGPDVGGQASPSPTGTLSPTATPMPLPSSGALAPGTYVTDANWADLDRVIPITFTLPDGWGNGGWALERPPGASQESGCTSQIECLQGEARSADGKAWISFWTVANTYSDPCRYPSTVLYPSLGPTVDDFITAMTNQVGSNATAPEAVTIDGRTGKRFEMDSAAVPSGTCEMGEYRLWVAPGSGDGSRWTGNFVDMREILWVLDVPNSDGGSTRLVIDASLPRQASADDRTEVEAILASMRIGANAPEVAP